MLYFGSANFTRKAWQGINQELGLVVKDTQPAQMLKTIFLGLSVSPDNEYGSLADFPPEKVEIEDDEYSENTDFPDFIEHIQLTPNTDHSEVQFMFEFGNRDSADKGLTLADYVVQWSGIKLEIIDARSQWIARHEFQSRLVGARSISFQRTNELKTVFWFPFQYAANLISERETFLHPSSWDWMAFYLNPDRSGQGEPGGVYIPGEPGVADDDVDRTQLDVIRREDNCVIAMQGYLTLFSRVESDFFKRIKDMENLSSDLAVRMLQQQIIDPLTGLSRLLEREAVKVASDRRTQEIDQSDLFKMGELLQLVTALQEETANTFHAPFRQLRSQIRTTLLGWHGNDVLRAQYLQFSTNKEVL